MSFSYEFNPTHKEWVGAFETLRLLWLYFWVAKFWHMNQNLILLKYTQFNCVETELCQKCRGFRRQTT